MNEEFLQFVWKHQLFTKQNLRTTSGDKLSIIKPGDWNIDSGPDFFNASIKLNETTWVGNVEVHIKSSDWNRHNHQDDKAYNNVILHVVSIHDQEVYMQNGENIAVMLIEPSVHVLANYIQLQNEQRSPACHQELNKLDRIYVQSTIDSMLVDRIRSKTALIEHALKNNQNNWNETFYQFLATNLGFKINALPFEMLSRSMPLKILSHHTSSLMQLEALLYGQSGLLNEELLGDDYFLELRNEYAYLAKKYSLNGMEGHVWKFMRLRPANFPTIRIAQLAALLHQSKVTLSEILEIEDVSSIVKLMDVNASAYWDTHYRFNVPSKKSEKWLGKTSQYNILINTIVPFMYLYGDRNNKKVLKSRAIELLELIPPEKNSIINTWSELGINSMNAYDTQALIQLKNVYCDSKKCLKCQIGSKVINR